MTLRISTSSNYSRVLMGLRLNQGRLIRSQEQVATGRSLLRPSDDPIGATRALSLTGRIEGVARFRGAVVSGLNAVDSAAASLGSGSQLLAEARELILQGMNGTLAQDDREALATELEVLRRELVDLANTQAGGRYLFGGTLTNQPPWVETTVGGLTRVTYRGNEEEQRIQIGADVEIAINVTGSSIFGKSEPAGAVFDGLTGVQSGLTADEGSGYEYLHLRHDSTDPGAIGTVGLALVNGGADDTILNAQDLVIDAAAGTVQLGNGVVRNIPLPGDPDLADFTIANELGGELHLDFTGFTGADFNGTVTGNGSISLDGTNFTAIDFSETDLELKNDATGSVLHVDTTAVGRAGKETVTFGGSLNLFDALQGVVEDLRNADGLDQQELVNRLNVRLEELDRGGANLRVGLGVLGARSARLQSADARLQGVDLQLNGLLSETRDADLSEAVLDLMQAEQTLQLAQATGVRLIQTTLLNFLG